MSGAARAIKKPLKKVEKKLKDEILDPVINTVEGVAKAMGDDPLTAIATIGAAATGQTWAIPLINGASTVAKGGDLGDVAKSIAISAIAPAAVGKVSAVATNAITNLGVSAGASTAIGSVIGKTVVSAATGADLKTALIGGVSGEIAKTSTKYLKEAVPNFDKLSESQQNSVNKAVTTFIQSGGNVNEGILAGVANSLTDNINALSPKTAQFNEAIIDATTAGLQGQDAGAAFIGSLNRQGAETLGSKVQTYFDDRAQAKSDELREASYDMPDAAPAGETVYVGSTGASYDASADPEEAMGEKPVPLTEAEKADIESRTVYIGPTGASYTAGEQYAALDSGSMTDAGDGSGLSLAELKSLSLDELLALESDGSESAAIEIKRRTNEENVQNLAAFEDAESLEDLQTTAEPVAAPTTERLEENIPLTAEQELETIGVNPDADILMGRDTFAFEDEMDVNELGYDTSRLDDPVTYALGDTIAGANERLQALGYSIGDGMLGAIALTVEGGANAIEDVVNTVLDNEDQFEFKKEIGEDGLERNAAVRFIEGGAEFLKDKISTEMLKRRRDALPAKGMTFGEALPGGEVALDMVGRPYGTDKFATLLNASEEFGDVAIDMAMVSIPILGIPATILTGYFEGQADAERAVIARLREAQKDGTLADNVGYQMMLAEAGGDEDKAFKKYEESFLKYTAAAGSVEAISDFIVAKTAVKGVKTTADILKLPQKLQKALGIPASVTAAGLTGALTEAAQTAIVEKALKDAGHEIKFTETGGAYLQGFAGQGGAVAVAQTVSGLNKALKKKYEAGDVTPEQRTYIEQQIINPQGEFAGTPTISPAVDTAASVVDDTTFEGINTAEQDIAALGLPLGDVDVDPGEAAIATDETAAIPTGTDMSLAESVDPLGIGDPIAFEGVDPGEAAIATDETADIPTGTDMSLAESVDPLGIGDPIAFEGVDPGEAAIATDETADIPTGTDMSLAESVDPLGIGDPIAFEGVDPGEAAIATDETADIPTGTDMSLAESVDPLGIGDPIAFEGVDPGEAAIATDETADIPTGTDMSLAESVDPLGIGDPIAFEGVDPGEAAIATDETADIPTGTDMSLAESVDPLGIGDPIAFEGVDPGEAAIATDETADIPTGTDMSLAESVDPLGIGDPIAFEGVDPGEAAIATDETADIPTGTDMSLAESVDPLGIGDPIAFEGVDPGEAAIATDETADIPTGTDMSLAESVDPLGIGDPIAFEGVDPGEAAIATDETAAIPTGTDMSLAESVDPLGIGDPSTTARDVNFNDMMSLNLESNKNLKSIFETVIGDTATKETIANTPNDTWKSVLSSAEKSKALDPRIVYDYKNMLDVAPASEFVGTPVQGEFDFDVTPAGEFVATPVEVDDVATIIGKSSEEVTSGDVDTVSNIINNLESSSDLGITPETATTTAITPETATTTAITPETATETATETAINPLVTTVIPEEIEKTVKKEEDDTLAGFMNINRTAPELFNLDYIYDINRPDIFATAEQAKQYQSPYETYDMAGLNFNPQKDLQNPSKNVELDDNFLAMMSPYFDSEDAESENEDELLKLIGGYS
jgi:hypothetical protein